MTNDSDFKTWLEQGGAQTEKGRNSRAYAVRTIERNLGALGMPYQDLDEAWKADRFETLRERLRKMREDARAGGQDYRILMPDSDKPHNRLSSWGSWLGQYGRFLAGDPPGAAKDADRIRQYVLEQYIEPAREEGRDRAEVLVRDVNEALGLKEAWPNICQALAGRMAHGVVDLAQTIEFENPDGHRAVGVDGLRQLAAQRREDGPVRQHAGEGIAVECLARLFGAALPRDSRARASWTSPRARANIPPMLWATTCQGVVTRR